MNWIFSLFRTGFLQATHAVKINFIRLDFSKSISQIVIANQLNGSMQWKDSPRIAGPFTVLNFHFRFGKFYSNLDQCGGTHVLFALWLSYWTNKAFFLSFASSFFFAAVPWELSQIRKLSNAAWPNNNYCCCGGTNRPTSAQWDLWVKLFSFW